MEHKNTLLISLKAILIKYMLDLDWALENSSLKKRKDALKDLAWARLFET